MDFLTAKQSGFVLMLGSPVVSLGPRSPKRQDRRSPRPGGIPEASFVAKRFGVRSRSGTAFAARPENPRSSEPGCARCVLDAAVKAPPPASAAHSKPWRRPRGPVRREAVWNAVALCALYRFSRRHQSQGSLEGSASKSERTKLARAFLSDFEICSSQAGMAVPGIPELKTSKM